jgi:hypothetical protein
MAMSERRQHTDEILFVSALVAILAGLGLLFHTTGLARGLGVLWPLLLIAGGALLLFFSAIKGRSSTSFFAGALFAAIFGIAWLLSTLLGWSFAQSWPLIMISAGAAWLAAGFRRNRRAKAGFVVPSSCFVLLGALFCLFSFDVVDMSLGAFVRVWWPGFLILGGIVLFIAYGAARKTVGEEPGPPDGADGA